MKVLLLSVLFTSVSLAAFSQKEKKTLVAQKTTTPPKMDGALDDAVWQNVPIATGFVELQPTAGRHEKPEERTEVKILYDNTSIYIGARMYETSADKVAKELATRDNGGPTLITRAGLTQHRTNTLTRILAASGSSKTFGRSILTGITAARGRIFMSPG